MKINKSKMQAGILLKFCIFAILLFIISTYAEAQQAETQTAQMKLGHLWLGVSANGYRSNFEYLAGFFPNDYDIMANRGQYAEAYTGAGINLTATHWLNPVTDSLETVAMYSYANNNPGWGAGSVTIPIVNYLRYEFPQQTVNGSPVDLSFFGDYNPSFGEFQNHTYDEYCAVTDSTIFGVTVKRTLLAWSQTFNDNYVIVDLMFTNNSNITLDSVFINLDESKDNLEYSNGHNPSPASNDRFSIGAYNWQHYYGGKPGDSLRVYYEYSADDPTKPGDNMGAPALSLNGRLQDPDMTYWVILHASKAPFVNESNDIDDPEEPLITYSGRRFPANHPTDPYQNGNFYNVRGGFSDDNPMPGEIPGTHHAENFDNMGISDVTTAPAAYPGNASYRYISFGPYTFKPGQKIHIVYANGYTGIGFQMGQKIGKEWLDGTLQDPPNTAQMPNWNSKTGLFPTNFAFPTGATEVDMRKDRWISLGIDSVMLYAWRAKWNYEHNYNIPEGPPPMDSVRITGYGDGVEIDWSDPEAENMPNFAGYRIMRRVSNADTVFYSPIYDSDASDKALVHNYRDKSIFFGAQYYYYIQAKAKIDANDPNADPTTRGKIIYSNRTLYPDIDYINPPRASQNDLSKIRIVPNPYNIKDPLLITYGFTDQRNITFYNLPAVCTIKIFTENGDLVQTLYHNSPQKAGSEPWDMLTSSQQVINSGVYIAVFQKPDGEISYQKFLVVR